MDYNLIIDNMRKIVTSGSLSDVVVSIDYAIACTGSNNGTSSYHLEASVCTLGTVASSSFIAYNNLTEGTVKSWITGSSDWSERLSNAEAELSSSIWPPFFRPQESNGLPW